MATAADIIRRSLKLLGILAAGESLSAEDQADCLVELNALLGTWANERLLVHGTRSAAYATLAGVPTFTLGPAGDSAAARPLRIDAATIIRSGETTEEPLRVLTDQEWQRISDKLLSDTVPSSIWIEQTYPAATVHMWPVPSAPAILTLYFWSRIAEFASSDTVSLPDGYENALAMALALQVAPMYGVEPSGTLLQNAANALAAIQRTNAPDVLVELDAGILPGGPDGGAGSVVLTSSGTDYGVLY